MNTPGNKAAKKAARAVSQIRAPFDAAKRDTPAPAASIECPPAWRSKPIALILGGADCLKADMARALALFTPSVIIAVNNAGYDHPGPLDHWATMHPDKMPEWVKKRRANGYPDAGTLWRPRHRQPGGSLEMRDAPSWGGSSGLFACVVAVKALEMRGVLCGVPMQVERAHYDSPKPWNDCRHYLSSWKTYLPQIAGRVRSMSGWTRELLGEPDGVWIG